MAGTGKRDIMDALLKGSSAEAPGDLKLLDRLIHKNRGKDEENRTREKGAPSRPDQRRQKARKKKTTHYLSKERYEDLGDAQSKINRFMQRHLKSRVSRSRIVDQALKMILKDFEEKGEKSPLLQEIIKDVSKE